MTDLPASPRPSVILLGGASGSGKSPLARRLVRGVAERRKPKVVAGVSS